MKRFSNSVGARRGYRLLGLERLEQRTLLDGALVPIELVSLASDGSQGNGDSYWASVSGDGRYVAFQSYATNFAPGNTNGDRDVFVYDRDTDTVERVSQTADGTVGDGDSYYPSISGDGRYVAFSSRSWNLAPGDTNTTCDVFVYDRDADTIARVSVASDGSQGSGDSYWASISGDGRYVAFQGCASELAPGDTNGVWDVFRHDCQSGATSRVSLASDGSQGNGHSYQPAISGNGRYVAFFSVASNLVAGDTNGCYDVFVYDCEEETVERVSVASDGSQANGSCWWVSISADGRYVAVDSYATNLVPGDTNDRSDVFLYDRDTDTIKCLSMAPDGSMGDESSYGPSISGDGRYIAFESWATDLVSGDTNGWDDIFVYDRDTDEIERVNLAWDGSQSNRDSRQPSISADATYVAFESAASNLVSGDANAKMDVFAVSRAPNVAPVVGSLSDSPDPVTPGDLLTLTASDVSDEDGSVAHVEFYADANANGTLEPETDTLLGTDSYGDNGWNWGVLASDLGFGSHTYFARAQDNDGAWSDAVSTTGEVAYHELGSVEANGVTIVFYDVNALNGYATLDIVQSGGKVVKGTTDVFVNTGKKALTISAIQLLDGGLDMSDIGIVVQGEGITLGKLTDSRKVSLTPIAFLACQGGVGAVSLNGGMRGAALDGLNVEHDWLPADLDGDEDGTDLTALYVAGALGKLTAKNNVEGDVIGTGQIGTVTVQGGDITGDVFSETGIKSVTAKAAWMGVEWEGGSITGDVRAEAEGDAVCAIGSVVTSRGGIGGDVVADGLIGSVTATGGDIAGDIVSQSGIKSVTAKALWNGAAWVGGGIAGDVRADNGSSISAITTQGGDLTGSLYADGTLGKVGVAGKWAKDESGVKYLVGGSVASDATITVDGVDAKGVSLNSVKVQGDFAGSLSAPNGTVTSVGVDGDLGGSLSAKSLGSVSVKGDMNGAGIVLSLLPDPANPKLTALGKVVVKGWMNASSILSAGNIGSVTVGAMENATIFAGTKESALTDANEDGVWDLPNPDADLELGLHAATIGTLKVSGVRNEAGAWVNSFVNSNAAAFEFLSLNLFRPAFGVDPAFGVAADEVMKCNVLFDDAGEPKWTRDNLTDPGTTTKGNFQVRLTED